MGRGTVWSHGDLLGAHLALNLAGWFGAAIIGTLHPFFPSLTETQLRLLRLQAPTYILWLFGVIELAIGAFSSRAVLVGGFLLAGLVVALVATIQVGVYAPFVGSPRAALAALSSLVSGGSASRCPPRGRLGIGSQPSAPALRSPCSLHRTSMDSDRSASREPVLTVVVVAALSGRLITLAVRALIPRRALGISCSHPSVSRCRHASAAGP